jgi:hypothetical protein
LEFDKIRRNVARQFSTGTKFGSEKFEKTYKIITNNYNKPMNNQNIKIIIIAVIVLFSLVFGGFFIWNKYQIQISEKLNNSNALTEREARIIAEASCIKGGVALSSGGTYNQNSQTWWFDANLNATQEGCNPACVVSEQTKTAEINWRCTGLIPPDQTNPSVSPISDDCEIENCHGLDIVCGKNPAQMCTEMYQLGDKCRQFAQCSQVNGKCQQIENPKFSVCKSCAQKCEKDFSNDPDKAFMCESKCGE